MNDAPTRRILVIDDEIFIRDLLRDFFSKLGFTVVTAPDGNAGVAEFRLSAFDVVLIDLKMPGKSGIETLREMHQIRANTPMIVMTGYPTIDSSIAALRLGACDYIIKPFKLQELKEIVDRVVREHALHNEIDTLREKVNTIEEELRDYRSASSGRAKEPSSS